MIHPSHPAPQSRDVGPASAAIRPKSAPRQVHDGQNMHRSASSVREDGRACDAQTHAARSSGHRPPEI